MGISRTLNDKLSQTEDVSCLRDESPSVNTFLRRTELSVWRGRWCTRLSTQHHRNPSQTVCRRHYRVYHARHQDCLPPCLQHAPAVAPVQDNTAGLLGGAAGRQTRHQRPRVPPARAHIKAAGSERDAHRRTGSSQTDSWAGPVEFVDVRKAFDTRRSVFGVGIMKQRAGSLA